MPNPHQEAAQWNQLQGGYNIRRSRQSATGRYCCPHGPQLLPALFDTSVSISSHMTGSRYAVRPDALAYVRACVTCTKIFTQPLLFGESSSPDIAIVRIYIDTWKMPVQFQIFSNGVSILVGVNSALKEFSIHFMTILKTCVNQIESNRN